MPVDLLGDDKITHNGSETVQKSECSQLSATFNAMMTRNAQICLPSSRLALFFSCFSMVLLLAFLVPHQTLR